MEQGLAPAGNESWFVLANAPSLDRFSAWDCDAYTDQLVSQMERVIPGFSCEQVEWTESRSPQFFQNEYHAWQGQSLRYQFE